MTGKQFAFGGGGYVGGVSCPSRASTTVDAETHPGFGFLEHYDEAAAERDDSDADYGILPEEEAEKAWEVAYLRVRDDYADTEDDPRLVFAREVAEDLDWGLEA